VTAFPPYPSYAEVPAPRGETRLVLPGSLPDAPTARQDTDCRTALTRGMCEYLSQLVEPASGGALLRLRRAFETWAEAEDPAEYPAACVWSDQAGTYVGSKLSPSPAPEDIIPETNAYVVQYAGFELTFYVDLWCTEPAERRAFVAMFERALNPLAGGYGFVLALPHYFNVRAQYELISTQYVDSEDEARKRIRRAIMTVKGSVPMLQLRTFPKARPYPKVTIVERD